MRYQSLLLLAMGAGGVGCLICYLVIPYHQPGKIDSLLSGKCHVRILRVEISQVGNYRCEYTSPEIIAFIKNGLQRKSGDGSISGSRYQFRIFFSDYSYVEFPVSISDAGQHTAILDDIWEKPPVLVNLSFAGPLPPGLIKLE